MYCPNCGADITLTERRIDGNSICAHGCKFPTSEALDTFDEFAESVNIKVTKAQLNLLDKMFNLFIESDRGDFFFDNERVLDSVRRKIKCKIKN